MYRYQYLVVKLYRMGRTQVRYLLTAVIFHEAFGITPNLRGFWRVSGGFHALGHDAMRSGRVMRFHLLFFRSNLVP